MPRPLLPPRGIYIPTMMIYNRELSPTVIHTWIQLRGLAWGRDETSQLSMLELSDLTGKSRSTIYGHMVLLRKWGALRWRSSDKGTFIVAFPADTGEFFLDGDPLPPQVDSESPESRNLEKLYPSPSSPINQLDINAVEEREGEKPDQKINQLDLSQSSDFQKTGINSETSEKFQISGKRVPFFRGACPAPIAGSPQCVEDDADPIKIYKSLTGIRPNKPQREQLKAQIHDTNLWYSSVEHWQSHGWNPKNIVGILELYQRGGPSACRYCSKEHDSRDYSLSALNELREELKGLSNGHP
jgi:hypothetical protein